MSYAINGIGHQQLTVSSSAVSLTVPSGKNPTHAIIQCGATNTVRWRVGAAPTSSIGILLAALTILDFTDPMGDYHTVIKNIQFIATGSDATLDIEYFD